MSSLSSSRLRLVATSAVCAVVAGLLSAVATVPATADTSPPAGTIATVSTDALPTVQIDGIIWSTKIVGNTVYAGGSFSNARPAGNAAGVGNVARSNLLAFNLTTGALIAGFAPTINGTVNSVAASPDGSRLYIGGTFTRVNGDVRNRVAALNPTTGATIAGFAPSVNSVVESVVATNSTVYIGGNFTAVGTSTRARLAAITAGGALVSSFQPVADGRVSALAVSPDGSKVVVGGHFTTLNGLNDPGFGFGAVDATTGATLPWNINKEVRQAGLNASINSLEADSTGVYGTAYMFPVSGKTLEGSFRADWAQGDIDWLETCKGDSYDVAVNSSAMYLAGHPHDCSLLGEFPDTNNPRVYHRGMAWTKDATPGKTTLSGEFAGNPAPSLLNWWPDFNTGTVSGSSQGPWSVSASDNYVVYAGEFTRVNNTPQQGLVRFANKNLAPNRDGPRLSGAAYVPTITPVSAGSVSVRWQTNWDRDNQSLNYQLLRDGSTTTPIYTATQGSRANFDRPVMSYLDSGLVPGSSHNYRVRVTDPYGNTVLGNAVTVTIPSAATSAYTRSVLADGASSYWRLGESSGTAITDWAGVDNATAGSGVTRGRAGAVLGDPNTASGFPGTLAGVATAPLAVSGPPTFAVEAWFRTTSTTGGTIVDLGSAATITEVDTPTVKASTSNRSVFVDGTGRISFGIRGGRGAPPPTVQTAAAGYNDGAWHHVVGSIGTDGMQLFVDGQVAGQLSTTTTGGLGVGYWRIGGDMPLAAGGPSYLAGDVDEVAVYPAALSAQQVLGHYTLSGRQVGGPPNLAPTAAFTSTATDLAVVFDSGGSSDPDGTIVSRSWAFGDGGAATTATASHTYAAAGTYPVTLTVTDDGGATDTETRNITVTAPAGNAPPVASFTSTVSDLTATFTSTSTDPDGAVVSLLWGFGDGASATTSPASHTYAAAGTYPVTLTVTDDDGAVDTKTGSVTVSAPAGVTTFATDSFTRSISNGLGSAELGGAWTLGSAASNYAVSGGAARLSAPAGGTRYAYLNDVSSSDTDLQATVAVTLPTAASVYAGVLARRVGAEDYRARAVIASTGAVQLQLQRTGTTLSSITVPGLTLANGDQLRFRLQAVGTAPTTLQAKVWKVGTTEPAAWQVTATDATAALQAPGSVGLLMYLSASATPASTVVAFDDLSATSTSN